MIVKPADNRLQPGTRAYIKATIALGIGSFLVFSNLYIVQPMLPLFTSLFHVTPSTANLSISLSTLSISLALLVFGPLSDAVGRKNLMVWTMLLAMITTILTGLSPSFPVLLFFRMLQGFFLAGLPAIAIAYIGEEFPARTISTVVGIYIGSNTIGGMSGRILSGFVAEFWGWRASFFTLGVFGLLCFAFFALLLPASNHFEAKPFRIGKALRTLGGHMVNPAIFPAFLIGGLHFFILIGVFNYMTFLLSEPPFLLPPSIVGMLFITYLAGTAGSVLSGRLAPRLGRTLSMRAGIAVVALGLMLTLLSNLPAIVAGLLIISFGNFFVHTITSQWAAQKATGSKASASSLYFISYYFGGSLGSTYLSLFWNHWRWTGVVFGSLLILFITFSSSLYLKRHE